MSREECEKIDAADEKRITEANKAACRAATEMRLAQMRWERRQRWKLLAAWAAVLVCLALVVVGRLLEGR